MLITVDRFLDPLEAYIVKGRLNAEGVSSYIIHAQHIWVSWTISVALDLVKLQAAAPEVDRARHVIDKIKSGEYERLLRETENLEINPVCQ